jgi:hypothetical protein
MLINVASNVYANNFKFDPHPFISEGFIELNKNKVSEIVRLVGENGKGKIGLVGGIIDRTLKSPFSAPFGGFHFRYEEIDIGEIDVFIDLLKSYIIERGLDMAEITLPPDIYNPTINAKVISSFLRSGFKMSIPEITHWVELEHFNGVYSSESARTKYNQAVRNGLSFNPVTDSDSMSSAYEIIRENRTRLGRPIYMTFENLIDVSELWPVDFFQVTDNKDNIVAAAILYRGHPSIVQAIFWGDNEGGRCLRAMDYCLLNLWNHYKKLGFSIVDISTSTEWGVPNQGLLRFKENHEAKTSLRFTFSWSPE